MKRWLSLCILVMWVFMLQAQKYTYANVSSKQFVFQAEIDNEPFKFISNDFQVIMNYRNGQFYLDVPVSSLYYSKINPLYKEHNDYDHECFHIEGQLPIDKVITEGMTVYESPVTGYFNFDGNRFEASINFRILNEYPDGYIIIAETQFPYNLFSISDEAQQPNDAVITFNFRAQ